MKYDVKMKRSALKDLQGIDKKSSAIIIAWIEKNLVNSQNPRLYGKALKGHDLWRYRVGNYRIVAQINDNEIKIVVIKIGHRKDIYKKL